MRRSDTPGVSRQSLNVTASPRGVAFGPLTFLDNGLLVDCLQAPPTGKLIPTLSSAMSAVKTSAKFVLVIEKEATFVALNECRYFRDFAILVTGKGVPGKAILNGDLATREFLSLLDRTFHIPILALVDPDPWGVGILGQSHSEFSNLRLWI